MRDLGAGFDAEEMASEMFGFVRELFPICRSITGDGIRETLHRIGERIRLDIHEIPSGTQVLDWTVPDEWNIHDAYIKDQSGRRVVDFRDSNLHVVGYSRPIHAWMPLSQLREHIHTLRDQPDLIPYRTSYYTETWGFCMEETRLRELPEGEYEVLIDSSLGPGSLTYGECFLPGGTGAEVLISCHCCHPSIANDNLSGIAVATQLAQILAHHLEDAPLRYSYRFVFIPGTIGSIAWLAGNEQQAARVKNGLVVSCVGDPGSMTYKRSRRGDAEIDRAVEHVLRTSGSPFTITDFTPYGYDERQYCSPGFGLPVGSLTRTPNGQYPEYHTSADNLGFVRPASLVDSLRTYLAVIELLEDNRTYLNLSPKGEPQLGRRRLYPSTGGAAPSEQLLARLWVLNLSDGEHSLLDIAERSSLPFPVVRDATQALLDGGLLAPLPDGD